MVSWASFRSWWLNARVLPWWGSRTRRCECRGILNAREHALELRRFAERARAKRTFVMSA